MNSNQAILEFFVPEKGLIDIPGFCSIFSASDFKEFESKYKNVDYEEEEVLGKENLFYLKEANAIILRPDLMPVDMTGQDMPFGYKGIEYGCYGGSWRQIQVAGTPKALCEFQKDVKDKDGKVVNWYIHQGKKEGKFLQDHLFDENQGFCVWISENYLPENEKKVWKFYLGILESQTTWKECIYLEIQDGKDCLLAYQKTIKTKNTIPPKSEKKTQWESFILKKGKKIYDWTTDFSVICLFFVDDYIVISHNGLDNYTAIKCQFYDVGKDENGNEYPVILNAGSEFWIEGKGQIAIGWKKCMFKKNGSFQTKLFFPTYKLNQPKIKITKKYVFQGTKISGIGYHGGKLKLGGKVEIGPLANVDWEKGVYAEITLKGEPISNKDYFSSVTYKTPVFFEGRIIDKRKRKTSNISPIPPITSDIVSVNVSASSMPSDLSFSSFSSEIEIECTENEAQYIDLFNRKMLYGKLKVIPRESQTIKDLIVSIYGRISFKVEKYKEYKMKLEGECIKKRLEDMPLGMATSVEGLSHSEAIIKLCEMAGAPYLVEEDSSIILKGGKDKDWIFSQGANFWEAMRKIAKVSGYLLYVNKNGQVVYKKIPSDANYTFSRDGDISDIEYRSIDMWKTRIFVIGKAGKDTEEYFKGDTLSGAIIHKTLENLIGFDYIHNEVDDTLSDWNLIRKRLETLDNNFNKNNLFVSFTIPDARDFLDISLYDVFLWQDPINQIFNNKKFIICNINFEIDAFNCRCYLTGKMI